MPNSYSGPLIAIGGPTASGKSLLAARLAERLGGVVINADSLQIYAVLPVLTAQPDAALQAICPHRLYGVLPPAESLTAASWAALAQREIDAAIAAGLAPIVVGGSGLYLEALLDGLAALPDVPPEFRRQAMEEHSALGMAEFHRRLVEADPLSTRLHPGDTQRVLRAWEVWLATGRSLYSWHEDQVASGSTENWRRIAVLPERADLYVACNARFTAMIEAGVLEEVKEFAATEIVSPVTRALGYAEIISFIDGASTFDTMLNRAQAATRHYAKRQNTWFKNRFSQLDMVRVGTLINQSTIGDALKDLLIEIGLSYKF